MWTDDHEPAVPTSQWKPGQTVEYTRTVFVPIYPYVGEAGVQMGLYSAKRRQAAAARRARTAASARTRSAQLQLLPQTENIFLIFKDGWHPAEAARDNSDGRVAVDEEGGDACVPEPEEGRHASTWTSTTRAPSSPSRRTSRWRSTASRSTRFAVDAQAGAHSPDGAHRRAARDRRHGRTAIDGRQDLRAGAAAGGQQPRPPRARRPRVPRLRGAATDADHDAPMAGTSRPAARSSRRGVCQRRRRRAPRSSSSPRAGRCRSTSPPRSTATRSCSRSAAAARWRCDRDARRPDRARRSAVSGARGGHRPADRRAGAGAARRAAIATLIAAAAERHGVEPRLARGGHPGRVELSRRAPGRAKGAMGLMQLMPRDGAAVRASTTRTTRRATSRPAASTCATLLDRFDAARRAGRLQRRRGRGAAVRRHPAVSRDARLRRPHPPRSSSAPSPRSGLRGSRPGHRRGRPRRS